MAETSRTSGLIGTLGIKAPVRAATTANITLTGEQTVDGVALVAEDRVLVKDQVNAVENGLYYVQLGAWSRAPDFDGARDVVTGTAVNVVSGTANAVTQWRVTTTGDIMPGTTSLAFALSATAFGADIAAITHAATLDRPLAAHEFPAWSSDELDLRKVTVESLRERVNILDYLTAAEYNDVTTRAGLVDVRARIQTRIDLLETAGGGVLYFPPGLYMIGAAIVLPAKVILLGAGTTSTEIKLLAGANSNTLQTKNFATLTLQNKWLVSEGVPTGFGFDGIKFNGNRANQAVAGGIAIYGKKYHIGYDVQIVSMKGVGFYSECAYKGGEAVPEDQPEGYIGKLQVWESGQENVIYRGPHDQPIGDIYSALAGRDGVYNGVVFDGKVNVYQGITYVNGTVHSYASTGHGVVCQTQMMFNKLSGESNAKSGVVFEDASANWIGAFYTNVSYLEGYHNDVNGTGLYWNFENRVLGTNIGELRHSVSTASAGSLYNTGHGLTVAAGVVNCAGLQNGKAFKNDADFCNVDLKIYNANKAGDVGFESGAGNFCNYRMHLFGCNTLAWLNSGTTLYNKYNVEASQSAGVAFSNTGTFSGTDTFDVKLVVGGVASVAKYNDIQRVILQGATTAAITHNAFKTPTEGQITITPNMDWRNAGVARTWWISNITATTFQINTDVAAPVGGLTFFWKLDI